jgi:hypothetical protein
VKIICASVCVKLAEDEGAGELDAALTRIGFAGPITITTTPDTDDPDNYYWITFDPIDEHAE